MALGDCSSLGVLIFNIIVFAVSVVILPALPLTIPALILSIVYKDGQDYAASLRRTISVILSGSALIVEFIVIMLVLGLSVGLTVG